MMEVALIALGVLALSVAVAGALIRRSKAFAGFLLRLLPIALMEWGLHSLSPF